MKLKTFPGGVHPPDRKSLSVHKQIEPAVIPNVIVCPMSQHIGAPCQPRVKEGDKVKAGQLIGQADSFVSAPVHAPISGTIKAVCLAPHPIGKPVMAVTIESDGLDAWDDAIQEDLYYSRLEPKDILNRVRNAGIVGLGGAAFPTAVKLSPPKGKRIDTVILNGVECEPYLTADHRIMLEEPEKIIAGLRLIMKVLNVDRAFIGIESNKPDAIESMSKVAKGESGIYVQGLKLKYPQGAEKQLIKAILGREVPPPPCLPLDVGVVVQNAGTCLAVYEAVRDNKPLVERVVTVTGSAINDPKNLRVRLGTSFSDLIAQCGNTNGSVGKVIMGGPMMGIAQHRLDVPVIKGTSGILVLNRKEAAKQESRACIRCGQCIRACPMNLLPNLLGIYCEKGRWEDAEKLHIFDCMECGSCSYICPASRQMVHLIKLGKQEILSIQKKREAKS
ncbi:electron transport complex subunit RsxC [bacterium]|nr:electron transport complex subunit RsxC [bacterium]